MQMPEGSPAGGARGIAFRTPMAAPSRSWTHAMRRKRETPPPASSATPSGNANVPISVPPEFGADDALLALERQFEGLAREFAILLRTDANQNGERTRGHGCDAGRADQTSPNERSCEPARAAD